MRYIVPTMVVLVLICVWFMEVPDPTASAHNSGVRMYELEVIRGHRVTLMLVPCNAVSRGYLFVGYNIFRASWRDGPPALFLPTAPPCP